jgi:hypothetical protein
MSMFAVTPALRLSDVLSAPESNLDSWRVAVRFQPNTAPDWGEDKEADAERESELEACARPLSVCAAERRTW